jgi:lipopolysaccharide transport system ATP-binding protein
MGGFPDWRRTAGFLIDRKSAQRESVLMSAHLQKPKDLVDTSQVRVAGADDNSIVLEAHNLGKKYGDFWALRGVDLTVARGESLGIIGLNGAGKSTLLKILAGTLVPTEGTVRSSGKIVPLLDLSAGFNDDFTGLENLYLSASIMDVPRSVIDRHLIEIEDFAEIGDFVRKPMRTYSTGMRVRLAFALLTQIRPDLLIVDEVLAVGDAYFAHKCARLIRQFRDEGRSLLFVSHDPSAVKTYCESAILLDRGVVLRTGRPADVLDYYNAIIAAKEREQEIRVAENARGQKLTRSGDGLAGLNRADLIDEQGKSVRAVVCGSTVRIVCGVSFNGQVVSPTVGFLIRDRLGNDIFGTNTYNLGVQPRTYSAGEKMEVAFALPLTLGPGSYSITVAVHAGADHRAGNHDWQDNLIAFSIVPQWPFQFAGVVALPVSATISDGIQLLSRQYRWNEPIIFAADGNCAKYLSSGWSYPEPGHCWTLGKLAVLAVEFPAASGGVILSAEVSPFLPPGTQAQTVELIVADRPIKQWTVAHLMTLEAEIPAGMLAEHAETQLWFRLPDAVSASTAGLSEDSRELGLAFRRVSFFPLDTKISG